MYKRIVDFIKEKKPLVIFDLETTGLFPNMDKIIEIAYLKIYPDGRTKKNDIFLNPEMKISEEAAAVHGIRNEDVADKPNFEEKAQELRDVFYNCYYGGFNVLNFDLPFLKREFLRVGINFEYSFDDIIDSKVIFHYMEPRTLSAAYKFYCRKEHKDAHSALFDVEATVEVLEKQLDIYREIRGWDFMRKVHSADEDRWVDNDRKFYWRDGEAYFAFSKYKGEALAKVAETDTGFLQWILSADFSDETKDIIRGALNGKLPKKG